MTQEPTEQARLAEFDGVLADQAGIDGQTPAELFAVVDALDAQSALRRALSDPAIEAGARQGVARRLFDGRIGPQASWVVQQAVGLRWASGTVLADAIERQGVRSLLRQAADGGHLDEVVEQLYAFLEVVRSDSALRQALGSHGTGVDVRRQVVERLLAGKVHGYVLDLVRRAVAMRERTTELTIEHYLRLAAGLRGRDVAQVTVARALTGDQEQRLRQALSRIAGREVDIQATVDPGVLGGVRVRLGDEVIEGTVADRLEQLHRQLA